MHQSIPFVTRSGGHSEWSTIDDRGFIIDLSLYSGIEVSKEPKAVTIRGSVLSKPLAVALAESGMFTGKAENSAVLPQEANMPSKS